MTSTLLAGLLILVGLVGIVVPVVPGLLIAVAATALWAFEHPAPAAWWVFWIAVVWYAVGVVTQYLLPGRRLRREGIGTGALLAGVALGILGFFVVPVIGAVGGFVLGIYLVELSRRHDQGAAWASTKLALRAVLHSIGIELIAGVAILVTFVVGVLVLGTG